MYLNKADILEILEKELIIRPLLNPDDQIGEITIDFRLGYDFFVSIQGREAYIDTSLNSHENSRDVSNFFEYTRRRPGETFILHPGQTILATSLEYVKIPKDIVFILNMRSSYSRLGISLATIVQPGYCGCLSLELTNPNKTPINLTVGSRIFQARLIRTKNSSNYFSTRRKYVCQVRPILSAAGKDSDLIILHEYWKSLNNQ